MEYPLLFFNMFYEDLVINPDRTVQRLAQYLGINEYLNNAEAVNIARRIQWTLHNGTKHSKQTMCQMQRTLTSNGIEEINDKIESVDIHQELLRQLNFFHESCPN